MTFVPIPRYFNPTVIVTLIGTVVTFANGEGLNIRFNVTRTINATPDTAMVSIAGIDPIRARLMNKQFGELGATVPFVNKLIVQAGYDVAAAGLFRGDLRSFKTGVQRGPDVWTDIVADDGGDAVTDVLVPLPSTVGLTVQQQIDIATAAMGLVQSPSVAQVVGTQIPIVQGPFTAVGIRKASDLLDDAARRLGCRWYVRDDQLFLAFRGLPDPTRPAIVLTPQTVITPFAEDGSGLSTGTTFFDPNIVPGGQVVTPLGTTLRVEQVVHSGETRGAQVWGSRVTGRAL